MKLCNMPEEACEYLYLKTFRIITEMHKQSKKWAVSIKSVHWIYTPNWNNFRSTVYKNIKRRFVYVLIVRA